MLFILLKGASDNNQNRAYVAPLSQWKDTSIVWYTAPMSIQKVRRFLGILAILILCLISLGGGVRAMNAGLSCPDWPLCFGKVIPGFDVQVYFEFIHRVFAGSVAILTFVLGFYILKNPTFSKCLKKLLIFSWVLLLAQILMGGLTVLLKLHFSTVTAHLGLGTAFFSVILWLFMSFSKLKDGQLPPGQPKNLAFWLGLFLACAVYLQILLGGIVSSNYAGLACTDFPLCNGQWVPTFEGLVGLQVMHRLGAYFVFVSSYIIYFTLNAVRRKLPFKVIKASRMLISMVLMQVVLGMSNVLFRLPPIVTVLHLAVACMILGTCLRIVFLSLYESRETNAA